MGLSVLHSSPFYLPTKKKLCPYLAFVLIWVIFELDNGIDFVTLFAFFPIWVIFVLDDGIEFMTLFVTKTNRVIDYNNVFSFINLNLEKPINNESSKHTSHLSHQSFHLLYSVKNVRRTPPSHLSFHLCNHSTIIYICINTNFVKQAEYSVFV